LLGLMLGGLLVLGVVFQGLIMLTPMFAALLPVAMVMLAVLGIGRLGLWGVISVANGRSSVRETLTISQTGFWGLIGAYLLWSVIALVAMSVIGAITQMLAAGLGVRTAAGAAASLGESLAPGWLVYHFINGFAGGLFSLGLICVGAFTWHGMGQGKVINRAA
jgi:hypothetical protein